MKILIVGSLYDVELKALVDTMKSKTTTQDPLATFYEGILFNKPVVENYIPWRDFSTTVKLDDFGNWIQTIVESKTYLESVRR